MNPAERAAVSLEALSDDEQRGYWWMWNDEARIYERDYDADLTMRWWLADGMRDDHLPDDWHTRFEHVQKVSPLQSGAAGGESALAAAEQRAAELAAANAGLLSIVERFVALPSGAWHPERHAAEEAELVTEARAAIDAARRLFGSAR